MNPREEVVKARYEAEGWRMLRNGAPDFVALKVGSDGEITDMQAVEVKGPKADLTYEQSVFRKVFEKAGIRYCVEVVE